VAGAVVTSEQLARNAFYSGISGC